MDLGPRPQLSFDSFGHVGRVENLKRGDQLEEFTARSAVGLESCGSEWCANKQWQKQQVKVYCTYIYHIYMFMHVYCPCILRMFMWRSKKVFRACEVFIIFVILLIEILFREPAARRCDQTEHCRRWGCRRSCLCSSQALRPFAAELALVFSCCRQLQQSWFAMSFPAYQWRGWILNLSLTNQTCLLVLRYFGTVFGYPFWQGLLAQRAIQRGPPTAPRRPRRGRPVPKPVQERTPRLPPLSDDVWKPEPVAEEEVLLATKVDGQSLKDVAAEVSWWRLFFPPHHCVLVFWCFLSQFYTSYIHPPVIEDFGVNPVLLF